FLAFWLAAAPYADRLNAGASTDGIWAALFPYWVIGQIVLTAWACFNALALPDGKHRALIAGLGAGLLSLAGLVFLGLEDGARAWLDVIGIIAGIAIGFGFDRFAAARSLRLPAARHLVWLWLPGAAFMASALLLVNRLVESVIVDAVTPESLWLLIPLVGGLVMTAGWRRMARARAAQEARAVSEMLGALMVVAGAAAPALVTGFVFHALFLQQVVGL
ncbi:MAG: hypothetical protein HQ495_14525, partial [Alphaproteobacteria bacterium]|nr:hypothetical protein [Alphaproteobacteria bacterium]